MTKLYLKNIIKSYENEEFLVKIDELKIKKGEFFGLIGSSGCGKTTLLKLIAGLLEPDKGKIYIDKLDVTNAQSKKRNLTMVFQQPLLFPHLTVEQNIEFGLKMNKVKKKKRKELANKYLKQVGLEGYNNRYPSEISGGQKQRVSIARAMVLEPEILLMDEPFSALDPHLREEMRQLIKEIHKKNNITIVFVTHDIDEAFELFDSVGLMKNGRLIEQGRPIDIYKKPRTIYSARFLNQSNIIKLPFEELNLKESSFEYAIIRPESFEIEKISKVSNEKVIGVIKNIKFKPGVVYFYISIKDRIIEVLTKSNNIHSFTIGETVNITYNPQGIHFIKNYKEKE